jgi:uncharacterized protein YndB with AHSA1/START domain/quercetin dioxygenase-like cupin family protein
MVSADVAPIVRSIEIGAPPERVFRLLTDPEELVRWWPDAAELDPRVGGRLRFELRGGEAVVTGEVTRYEPPRALAFTWFPSGKPDHETRVEFTLTPAGEGGSRVEVVHSGWDGAADLRPLHDEGWADFLGRLSAIAHHRRPGGTMSYKITETAKVEPLNGVLRMMGRELGVAAFGVNELELPPNGEGPEHDHAADGQEEVYVVVRGGGTIRLGGAEEQLAPGRWVFLSADQRRQMVAGPDGLAWIGVGCQPGAYKPPQFG